MPRTRLPSTPSVHVDAALFESVRCARLALGFPSHVVSDTVRLVTITFPPLVASIGWGVTQAWRARCRRRCTRLGGARRWEWFQDSHPFFWLPPRLLRVRLIRIDCVELGAALGSASG